MAKIKDWLIDMEEATSRAYEEGLSLEDALLKVKKELVHIDEEYIKNVYLHLQFGEEWINEHEG
jgi:hypothetical protein